MMGTMMLAKKEVGVKRGEGEGEGEGEMKHSVLQGKYELGRVLGQGTFARVYHARNVQTGKSVAMKVVGKEKVIKAKMMEQMKREISVMKRVKHPNIVELYEVMATKSKIYLAMELVRGGELFTKISKGGKLDEDVARGYFRQLISAVGFCHSRGVYHRDLKLENLLLDHLGDLKVSDFGLSTFFDGVDQQEQLLRTSCGTPHYVAPEVVSKRGQGYDGAKADIWSCGVILYVLLAGYHPFHDDNVINMYRKIYKGDFKCPAWFSNESRDLIVRMLDPKPESRITIPQIVMDQWFLACSESSSAGIDYETIMCSFDENGSNQLWKNKEPEVMNAFHLIALSHGLDLSGLFYDKRRREESEELRFTTREPASTVISRLEEVAAKAGKFEVDIAGESMVRLQGPRQGRQGRLAIAAELYSVSKSFLVVEVKKDNGNPIEFNQFCHNQLLPALQDIVWTADSPTPA
ncbi:hypothetical protein vseg_010380 [Gypsophila vaccaria]